MWRIGNLGLRRDGFKPVISAPNPWYKRLSKIRKALLVVDILLSAVGIVATTLGIPFGLPLLGGAIGLLVFIKVVQLQIIKAETATLEIRTPEPTIQRSCPECGDALDENPDYCSNCGWESENPIGEDT
jgi:hypothetical protein